MTIRRAGDKPAWRKEICYMMRIYVMPNGKKYWFDEKSAPASARLFNPSSESEEVETATTKQTAETAEKPVRKKTKR